MSWLAVGCVRAVCVRACVFDAQFGGLFLRVCPSASSGLYALDTASMEISPVGDCGTNVSRIARSANLTVAVSWDGTDKQGVVGQDGKIAANVAVGCLPSVAASYLSNVAVCCPPNMAVCCLPSVSVGRLNGDGAVAIDVVEILPRVSFTFFLLLCYSWAQVT